MIDKLVSADLVALGRDAAAGVPELEDMLTPEAPPAAATTIAPLRLLRLDSLYGRRVARAAFGAVMAAGVAICVALAGAQPDLGDAWFVMRTSAGQDFAFVLALAALAGLAARSRAEARFARGVAAAADPVAAGRDLVARVDVASLVLGVAGWSLYWVVAAVALGQLRGDLLQSPWPMMGPIWVAPLRARQLHELELAVPVLIAIAVAVGRYRTRLTRLARPAVMWVATGVALVAVRVAFQLGTETAAWEIGDPVPTTGIRTAATVITGFAVVVAVASHALRRRQRELGE
jgi:hypothetical protein